MLSLLVAGRAADAARLAPGAGWRWPQPLSLFVFFLCLVFVIVVSVVQYTNDWVGCSENLGVAPPSISSTNAE